MSLGRISIDDLSPSPDGRTLAVKWVRTLVLYDTPDGRVRHRLETLGRRYGPGRAGIGGLERQRVRRT
jgi:hypothetical protein